MHVYLLKLGVRVATAHPAASLTAAFCFTCDHQRKLIDAVYDLQTPLRFRCYGVATGDEQVGILLQLQGSQPDVGRFTGQLRGALVCAMDREFGRWDWLGEAQNLLSLGRPMRVRSGVQFRHLLDTELPRASGEVWTVSAGFAPRSPNPRERTGQYARAKTALRSAG